MRRRTRPEISEYNQALEDAAKHFEELASTRSIDTAVIPRLIRELKDEAEMTVGELIKELSKYEASKIIDFASVDAVFKTVLSIYPNGGGKKLTIDIE